MPTTKRSRTFASPPEALWEVVSSPDHLPRWWPGVTRVENVYEHGFTEVMESNRGRKVRLDFHITELDAPRRARWEQELAGTPFERFLRRAAVEIELAPAADGTRVTLVQDQALKGTSRFGGLMVRRAARVKLDEALEGLARICE